LTIGLDFGLEVHGEDAVTLDDGTEAESLRTAPSKYVDFGVAPWVDIGVGGGKVRIGVVIMVPCRDVYNYNSGSSMFKTSPRFKKGYPVVSIPVSFTYSF
jgi:hypothetical protein